MHDETDIILEIKTDHILVSFKSLDAKEWAITNLSDKTKWLEGKLIVSPDCEQYFLKTVFDNEFNVSLKEN